MTLSQPLTSRLSFLAVSALMIALMGAVIAAPSIAWADDPQQRIDAYLDEAEEHYNMLFFEDAVTSLRDGIDLAEEHDIRTSQVAELHIFLGLIRHADGDDGLAEDAFVDALEIDPDITVDSSYQTPAVDELMAQARQRAEPPPEPEPETEPADDVPDPEIDSPPPEEDVDPLTHEPIQRADAGEVLTVEAEIPADLPVFRVHLHQRRYGEDDFTQSEMEPTDATGFSYRLDGTDVRTSQIEYFITAIDRTGEVIAESGRRTRPHRIAVIGDIDDDSETHTEDDAPTAPDVPDDFDPTGPYATATLGTDIGFLPGGTPPTANHQRTVSPGLSPAFAHTFVDIGWRISEYNNVGMYFRWQFTPHQDFDQIREHGEGSMDHISTDAAFWEHRDECFGLGLPGDCMLGIRYQRMLSTDIPEFYSSVGMGIGRVRNWLKLRQLTDSDDPDPACQGRETFQDANAGEYCELRDTVRTGWAHFGVGGGMYIPVHDNLDLVADSYLMVLVPDTSVNLDINLGIRYRH